MATAGSEAKAKVRRDAERGRGWYSVVARVGLVAKGVSFGLVGALAIKLAVGDGGKATSRAGALESLARNGFGKVALLLLALGFASYALWRFVQAVAEREPDDDEAKGFAKKWGKRAGYAGRGAIYAALTYSALHILTGADERSQNATARRTTAGLFDLPGGRWLVGLVGLAIVGAGLWNGYIAVTRKFEDKWYSGKGTGAERSWGLQAGIAGHLARAAVFTLVGVFITKAALEYDAKEAIGLDGALQKLAGQPYGPWLLGLTAVGLIAYGVFCLVDARCRDVSVNNR